MGQRGGANRSREALGAAKVWRSASAVGCRQNVLVALSKQKDEQGLRTVSRDKRDVRLRSYNARDGETFGLLMRLFGRSLYLLGTWVNKGGKSACLPSEGALGSQGSNLSPLRLLGAGALLSPLD